MSLTARSLEESGIATVIVGAARDIVEECGVPRFVFSDSPLGNPLGPPYDVDTQRATLDLAFGLLESATLPRTTVQAPHAWPTEVWRHNYMLVDETTRAGLEASGAARRARQAEVKRVVGLGGER